MGKGQANTSHVQQITRGPSETQGVRGDGAGEDGRCRVLKAIVSRPGPAEPSSGLNSKCSSLSQSIWRIIKTPQLSYAPMEV